jgi:hypothetical protein
MIITTTRYALGELAYKARIVADEPDLQEDYQLTEAEAEDATHKLMEMERHGVTLDTEQFSPLVLKMLEGECDDAAVVQRSIARTAMLNERAGIQRGARQLEALADAIRASTKGAA